MPYLDDMRELLVERLTRALRVAETISGSSDTRDAQYVRDQLDLAKEPLKVIEDWAKAKR